MGIYNTDRQRWVVKALEAATGVRTRTRGLIGHQPLQAEQGLMIDPCRWIHTFRMSFPIDVAYVGKSWQVVALTENLVPNRIDRPIFRARFVIEMMAGTIRRTGLAVGDQLELRA
jgi:uncharacterized membrane protein (UPF0127 family)